MSAIACEWTSAYLLLLPERKKTDTGHLDDLETDTGNITLSLTPATEARDQDLVVLVDEVEATIVLRRETARLGLDALSTHTASAPTARMRSTPDRVLRNRMVIMGERDLPGRTR